MAGDLFYLDSSALVKLVMPEAESGALLASLEAWPARVTSELATVEVMRAARRVSMDPAVAQRAEEVLAGVHLLKIAPDLLDRAARLEPRLLRSLDALHLASALSLGDDLGAMAVYDGALATAAAGYGLTVVAPGRDADQLWFHQPEMQVRIRRAEDEIAAGRLTRTETLAQAQSFLDSLKKRPRQRR